MVTVAVGHYERQGRGAGDPCGDGESGVGGAGVGHVYDGGGPGDG